MSLSSTHTRRTLIPNLHQQPSSSTGQIHLQDITKLTIIERPNKKCKLVFGTLSLSLSLSLKNQTGPPWLKVPSPHHPPQSIATAITLTVVVLDLGLEQHWYCSIPPGLQTSQSYPPPISSQTFSLSISLTFSLWVWFLVGFLKFLEAIFYKQNK